MFKLLVNKSLQSSIRQRTCLGIQLVSTCDRRSHRVDVMTHGNLISSQIASTCDPRPHRVEVENCLSLVSKSLQSSITPRTCLGIQLVSTCDPRSHRVHIINQGTVYLCIQHILTVLDHAVCTYTLKYRIRQSHRHQSQEIPIFLFFHTSHRPNCCPEQSIPITPRITHLLYHSHRSFTSPSSTPYDLFQFRFLIPDQPPLNSLKFPFAGIKIFQALRPYFPILITIPALLTYLFSIYDLSQIPHRGTTSCPTSPTIVL